MMLLHGVLGLCCIEAITDPSPADSVQDVESWESGLPFIQIVWFYVFNIWAAPEYAMLKGLESRNLRISTRDCGGFE